MVVGIKWRFQKGAKMVILEIVSKTLMITVFVTVMMLVVEYVNVQSRGRVFHVFTGGKFRQYFLAAVLGAVPGCLGAYVVVALYTHRKVSIGALVAAMISTSGDEMFVMLTLFPGTAVFMTFGLILFAMGVAWLSDSLLPANWVNGDKSKCKFELHEDKLCNCFPWGHILNQLKNPSPHRATLLTGLILVLLGLLFGRIGPLEWGWKRITFTALISLGIFISSTVPEHFLEEHLYAHVVKKHVPRIFVWTFGVLALLMILPQYINLEALISSNLWTTLGIASVVGLLPESGPHLIFVSLYSDGTVPLSVLVASSAIQDGHGMLPLLSSSKKIFVIVKIINLVAGFSIGAILLAIGW